MKIVGIIQARLGSTRFPNKMLEKIGDKSILEHCIDTSLSVKGLDEVILATPDQELVDSFKSKVPTFKGYEENVLLRFIIPAVEHKADFVLRICGDSPFFDKSYSEELIQACHYETSFMEYYTHKLKRDEEPCVSLYPMGSFKELIKTSALIKCWNNTDDPYDLQHVTPYIYKNLNRFRYKYIEINDLPEHIPSDINNPQDLEDTRRWYEATQKES